MLTAIFVLLGILAYLGIGYGIGVWANHLYLDETPTNELPLVTRMQRTLWFPFNQFSWEENRHKYYEGEYGYERKISLRTLTHAHHCTLSHHVDTPCDCHVSTEALSRYERLVMWIWPIKLLIWPFSLAVYCQQIARYAVGTTYQVFTKLVGRIPTTLPAASQVLALSNADPFDAKIEPIRIFLNTVYGTNQSQLEQAMEDHRRRESAVTSEILNWTKLRDDAVRLGHSTLLMEQRLTLLKQKHQSEVDEIRRHEQALSEMVKIKEELTFRVGVLEALKRSDALLYQIDQAQAFSPEFAAAVADAEALIAMCHQIFALEQMHIAQQPGADLKLLDDHATEQIHTETSIRLRLVEGSKTS